jgi:hypothetical protein
MSLVASAHADDDLEELRSRLAELEALLRERAMELERAKTDLAAFKIDYRQKVGRLHEELDELEHAIAEAELGELNKREDADAFGESRSSDDARPEPLARYTSDAVRKLFRDVAKAIHPDLAEDELARDRRHALMIEANRAYALGDEERLRWILQSWERRSEAVPDDDPDATRVRLVRRIAEMDERLGLFADDLAALKESPMWKLKAMVDEAAEGGRDLIREMVGRLRVDVMIARNRLAAIQWP